MKNYDEIVKYLKENEADFEEINQPMFKSKYLADGVYDIEIDGDWKHSHGYARYLMEQIGYVEVSEVVTEEDGSDWYRSVHRFADKNLCEIFKTR